LVLLSQNRNANAYPISNNAINLNGGCVTSLPGNVRRSGFEGRKCRAVADNDAEMNGSDARLFINLFIGIGRKIGAVAAGLHLLDDILVYKSLSLIAGI
jgi:hypothetical protein